MPCWVLRSAETNEQRKARRMELRNGAALGTIDGVSLGAMLGAAVGRNERAKEEESRMGPNWARFIGARTSRRSHAGCCGWDCRRQQGWHAGRSRGWDQTGLDRLGLARLGGATRGAAVGTAEGSKEGMPEGVADGTKLGSIDWGSLVSEEPRWVLRLGLPKAARKAWRKESRIGPN
jgi:hypothetical protein